MKRNGARCTKWEFITRIRAFGNARKRYSNWHAARRWPLWRPPKWDATRRQALGALAQQCGGTVRHLLGTLGADDISECTARRYLHDQGLRYKRCRYSVKKSAMNLRSVAPNSSSHD